MTPRTFRYTPDGRDMRPEQPARSLWGWLRVFAWLPRLPTAEARPVMLTTEFQPIAVKSTGPWRFNRGYSQADIEKARAAGHIVTAQRRLDEKAPVFELLAKLTDKGLRGI